ncbi:MAG TPA: PQQ-binding-like beta-propeller repeat protein [Acidobacteriota bacterium]|nr:PQQ-binding-like beta-propeller repeat protein [Acidobacteriota bacterium]
MHRRRPASALLLAGLLLTSPCLIRAQNGDGAAPPEWHQWRGPNRDGVSAETGLLQSWAEDGPPREWRVRLGTGYSGMAVSQGRLFTLYADSESEYAAAFDVRDGSRVWRVRLGPRFENEWGDGPRATPTVDAQRVYVVSGSGFLMALATADGRELWGIDLPRAFGGHPPDLGYSNSPLLLDGRLFVTTGGRHSRAFAALDKADGRVIWEGHTDPPGYSSPIAVTVDGVPQVIFFAGASARGLAPDDGEMLWRVAWPNSANENVATPVFVAPDRVFLSAAHRGGARMLRLRLQGDVFQAETVWHSRVMKNHFSSCVYYQGYIYGSDRSTLKCIDPQDGSEKWSTRGFGEGSLVAAEGRLYILGTYGKLALAEATLEAYREISSFQAVNGKTYTPPALSGARLYLRSTSELTSLNIRRPD